VKILLRADASQVMGTGHIMRCLTLARTLKERGHEPVLVINDHKISWLAEEITRSGVHTLLAQEKQLQAELLVGQKPDIVVVDSYWIESTDISALNKAIPTVAIIDGETRGIDCSLYVDQNLGSEKKWEGKLQGRILAGSQYALIREEITALHRHEGSHPFPQKPNVLIFAGGTDATGIIPPLLSEVDAVDADFSLTVVTSDPGVDHNLDLIHSVTFVGATTEFGELLNSADIVVAAAGTSSWEICTIGIPSVFFAVVENQLQAISAIDSNRCGEAVDLTIDKEISIPQISKKLYALLSDNELRGTLVQNCTLHFDGRGCIRVAEAIESLSLIK
jgi:UDP-2,4-diacetamido-2,4,6-trideoxy-beta-L-altropyranose hydrolase